MRLLSLEVEHFRAIQSARLQFGRGLNVVHGPNDHGKSTLTEAIRAALLVAPGTAESRSFATWGAVAGQSPRVVLGFESQGATWLIEKVFGQGSRAKAYLQKSTDGGVRYHAHAQARDVEGKLRELLNWGLAPPGGRGAPQRTDTYLTTALLGKQGEVDAIFEASLKRDQDETGRALVTRALDALGQDPVVTRLLARLKERSGEAYTASGRLTRKADSPLVRARTALKDREDRLRSLQEDARKGKEIEEQVRRLLQERETSLEARDQARVRLETLRRQAASAARREEADRAVSQQVREYERMAAAFEALEAARGQQIRAEAALTSIAEECQRAVDAAQSPDAEAQAARDRLARARAAHESSERVAASARGARVSDLRARLAAAQAAVTAGNELASLESKLAAAQLALDSAREEVSHASAELNLAAALEELTQATELTEALADAVSEHERQTARESVATLAVAEADAALKAAAGRLEQARRAAETGAMNAQVMDTRILHCEAAFRDEREALERAKSMAVRVRRAEEAQAAAAATDARAAEIDASLAANAAEIARGEARLRGLESMSLELRRRAAAARVDELSAQESAAREHRRRAAEARDGAARLEAVAAGVRLPAPQQVASLQAMHAEIKSRKVGRPPAAPFPAGVALLGGVAGAALGFAAARFGAAVGIEVSIGAALLLGIVASVVAGLASVRSGRRNAEASWRAEIEQMESRLAAETTLEEIESKRQEVETMYSGAERLRQEAAGFDREADSMFEICAGLASLRREVETVTGQLAEYSGTPAVAGGSDSLSEEILRERDRLDLARRVRGELQTEQIRQVAICASKRATADSALAECSEAALPNVEMAIADAESRWRAAGAQLSALRDEQRHVTGPSPALPLMEVEQGAMAAERRSADRQNERRAVVDDLARATARLDLARRAAEAICLPDIEARVAAARARDGSDAGDSDVTSAKARLERAKDRVSSASTAVELLAAEIPEARRKAAALGSDVPSVASGELASAEDEVRRLDAELRDAEIEVPVSLSSQELRDAEDGASLAEQVLTEKRALAASLTAKRDELRADAERARGQVEASERQTQGMDVAAAQSELANAREALAALEPAVQVSRTHLQESEEDLDRRNDALTACEGRLNELRGKLELVSGKVGLERLEEEQEAVQRAKEYAEEQELEYEASKHLLESLEAAEARRSSHLGRCLASPVTERFLALTGDFYAHVQLDPDLRMEGFVAAGSARNVEDLSVGTREQLATIVRLAIAAQLKTAVLLDDQLVHSDSERLGWFRKQVRNSVCTQDHQVIVMTCRLGDYAVSEMPEQEEIASADGPLLTIINVLDVVRRVRV